MGTRNVYPSLLQTMALVASLIGLELLLSIVVAMVMGTGPDALPVAFAIAGSLASGIVLFAGFRRTHAPAREVFALRSVRPSVVVAVAVSTVGLVILLSEVDNLIRFLLPVPRTSAEFVADMIRANPWTALVVAVVVAPVTEEMFFRGLVLRGLLSRYRVKTAMIVSAFLFALSHLEPWVLLGTFAGGLLFAWCVVRTGSLLPGLVGHVLHNLVAVLAMIWQEPSRGFTGPTSPVVEFQPVWFDLTGVALATFGLWWLTSLFRRFAPRETAATEVAAA